ncbi:MAG: M48 family metalloprotease, partial [Alphaproteobacteria bacterium]
MRFLIALVATIVLSTLLVPGSPSPAVAANSGQPVQIRDTEIENIIRIFGTPLFQAVGFAPDTVRLHLVVDKSLNAFVAEGLNLYLHTGLLIRTETADQLIGVMAHEIGHITGGHLVRREQDVGVFQMGSLLATVLGAAAAVASGRGDVGGAVAMAGSDAALKSFFSYTRSQESSADTAALKMLDLTGQSARGLLDFFLILGDQELLMPRQQDPYVRTHPLTRDRVEFVRHHVETSSHPAERSHPEYAEMHRRMRAKLIAFLEPTNQALLRYKENDQAIDARYVRAIAFYRRADLNRALPLIEGLIAERPADPYFLELKGQMLFENGRGREAIEPYRQAVRRLPDSGLLRISLGQVLIEQEDPSLLKEA